MKNSPALTPERLLEETSWMRALARSLVREPERAEDLTQETLAIALARPPEDSGSLRGWLAEVMRNLFREDLRKQSARRHREADAARPEALPGTDELLERLGAQQRVAERLLALEEPYRTTILLRYYEGLAPRHIAAQHGVPVATVKSRLHRGLAKLRLELDAEYGDSREAWALALTPWTREPKPLPWSTIGGVALNAKLVLISSAVAMTCGLLYFFPDAAGTPADSPDVALVRESDSAGRPAGGRSGPVRSESSDRTQLPRTPLGAGQAASAALPQSTVRGRALDASGAALVGVELGLRGQAGVTRTTAGGRFELRTIAEYGQIELTGDDWIAVRTGSWRLGSSAEPVVIAARSLQVEGTVTDAWGRDVSGARLRLDLPDDFLARFGVALDASYALEWSARSTEDGAFRFASFPAIPGAELTVVHDLYAVTRVDAPQSSDRDLWIELRRPELAPESALSGTVLLPDGAPAAGALVGLGVASARADRDGLFTLDLDEAGDAASLTAVLAGHLPATLQREGAAPERAAWPETIELVLGGAALTITGRVVTDAGTPLPGGRVWIGDPTRFGAVGTFPLRLEALMAGGAVPDQAIESLADAGGDGNEVFGSATPVQDPNALLYWVATDAEGRFTLPGLADRDYVLNVLDEGLHWGTMSAPIAAGSTGVEIVVQSDGAFETLRGRILTAQGDPIPGVTLRPWLAAVHAKEPVRGGRSDVMRFFLGESTMTDADGVYELRGVPRRFVQFHIISDTIVPSYASVEQVLDPLAFDIEVQARVHLDVEVAGGAEVADAMRVLDGNGAALTILQLRADGYSNHELYALEAGRSGVVTITSNATTLELLLAGEVVDRLPLAPRPGERIDVRR